MNILALFIAGALLCNSLPHLCSGLMGQAFPTPFARQHAAGLSAPVTNFLWGAANLIIGLYLVSLYSRVIKLPENFIAIIAGVLVLGTYLSLRFGKFMRQRGARP